MANLKDGNEFGRALAGGFEKSSDAVAIRKSVEAIRKQQIADMDTQATVLTALARVVRRLNALEKTLNPPPPSLSNDPHWRAAAATLSAKR